MKFFITPFLSMFIGLVAAGVWTWWQSHSVSHVVQVLLTVSLLSVLEISLSFDNAVVNATVLERMSEVWKKRFLTWGMAIAVFGMRFFFPLLIVSIVADLPIHRSLLLAFEEPAQYSAIMLQSHLAVSSFGGAFLLMVFLDFLMNEDPDVFWIKWIEKPASKLAAFQSIEIILAISVLLLIYFNLAEVDRVTFMLSYVWGILTYLLVHGLSALLDSEGIKKIKFLSSGLGLFLYLEVLDASFSFDGVVGAFAISNQLLIIVIGLGVGAFFVRGITLYLVERKTLSQFKFLEHGAFYALGLLASFMLLDTFFHFSEWITALSGAAVLMASIFWSIYEDRKSTAK